MRKVRKDTKAGCEEDDVSKFVPLTFESLLDYLYKKAIRVDCYKQIGNRYVGLAPAVKPVGI